MYALIVLLFICHLRGRVVRFIIFGTLYVYALFFYPGFQLCFGQWQSLLAKLKCCNCLLTHLMWGKLSITFSTRSITCKYLTLNILICILLKMLCLPVLSFDQNCLHLIFLTILKQLNPTPVNMRNWNFNYLC